MIRPGNCPWCKSVNTSIRAESNNPSLWRAFVRCGFCRATGPTAVAPGIKQARIMATCWWNEMWSGVVERAAKQGGGKCVKV